MSNLRLSDEVEARLAQLGNQHDFTAWELGDLTEYIFQLCTRKIDGEEVLINPATEDPIMAKDIYLLVAKHAGQHYLSIADYRYTSRNVPLSARQEYPMLFRSHFKALIPHYNTLDELYAWCDKILKWADDYGGQIISVAALREKLKHNGNGPPEWQKRFKRLLKTAKMLHDDEHAPAFVRQIASRVLKSEVPLP